MHSVVVLLGTACAGALAITTARQCVAGIVLALGMGSLWAAANLAYLAGRSDLIALIDLPVAVAAYAAWCEEGHTWQRALAAIMGARIGLHLFHPALGSAQEAAFFHVLNATFLAALVAIAWEGGIKNAVGSVLGGGSLYDRFLRLSARPDSVATRAAEG